MILAPLKGHADDLRQASRDRPRHHVQRRRHARRARPRRDVAERRGGDAHAERHPSRREFGRRRPGRSRRRSRAAAEGRPDRQALHGASDGRLSGERERIPPRDAVGDSPQETRPRRGTAHRQDQQGGHHRPRLLRRHPPQGDEGRGPDRRARRRRHPRRADRGRSRLQLPKRLRLRSEENRGADRPRLRPRRRHLRRVARPACAAPLPVARHRGRRPPRRQGLGRPDRRLHRHQVPHAERLRSARRRGLPLHAPAGVRAGQADALEGAADERDLLARRQGDDGAAHPKRLREPDEGPARPYPAHDAAGSPRGEVRLEAGRQGPACRRRRPICR